MGRRSRKRGGGGTAAVTRERPAPRSAGRAASPTGLDATRLGRRAAERPKAVWHPIPVSEIAIAGGLLLFVLGVARGEDGATLIGAGTLLATAGVLELAGREHFSGFRSHVLLLAFLPVVALHTVVALWIYEDYRGPVSILIDMAVFALLAVVLLDRYRRASRARDPR
ncbi:MAG TPA: hypothetical protein VD931_16510 [Baekduia sp.]|nr:hypothetical protein [Baekduia sp.]